MPKELLYIGTKLTKAFPRDENDFLRDLRPSTSLQRESRPGYQVTYPDGYVSWSPKETFEIAYREVSEAEMELMLKD